MIRHYLRANYQGELLAIAVAHLPRGVRLLAFAGLLIIGPISGHLQLPGAGCALSTRTVHLAVVAAAAYADLIAAVAAFELSVAVTGVIGLDVRAAVGNAFGGASRHVRDEPRGPPGGYPGGPHCSNPQKKE